MCRLIVRFALCDYNPSAQTLQCVFFCCSTSTWCPIATRSVHESVRHLFAPHEGQQMRLSLLQVCRDFEPVEQVLTSTIWKDVTPATRHPPPTTHPSFRLLTLRLVWDPSGKYNTDRFSDWLCHIFHSQVCRPARSATRNITPTEQPHPFPCHDSARSST